MKIITDLTLTSAPHRPRRPWSPAGLFASGTQGLWLDPTDQSTLFQDAAGTIPVVSDGDPVTLVLDKSRGLKLGPELVEMENLPEPIVAASGSPGAWNAATRSMFTPEAGTNSTYPRFRFGLGLEEGKHYFVQGRLGGDTDKLGSNVWQRIRLATGGSNNPVHYDPATGVFTARQVAGSSSLEFHLNGTQHPVTVKIDELSIREIPGKHVFQPAPASRPTWRSDGSQGWLEFDGVDDFLVSGSIDFSHTARLCSFAGVSNITPTGSVLVDYTGGPNPHGFTLFAVSSSVHGSRLRSGRLFGPDSDVQINRPDPAVYAAYADLAIAQNRIEANGLDETGQVFSSLMSDFETGNLSVGARNEALFLDGYLHYLIVLDHFPDESEGKRTKSHIAKKVGMPQW